VYRLEPVVSSHIQWNVLKNQQINLIKVLLPNDAQNNCFKRILKFTLKQIQNVSVLLPSSGSVQFALAKVAYAKTVH